MDQKSRTAKTWGCLKIHTKSRVSVDIMQGEKKETVNLDFIFWLILWSAGNTESLDPLN